MEFLSYDSTCYLVQASDVDFGQPLESYHFAEKHHNLVKACVSPLHHGLQADWLLSGVLSYVPREYLRVFATKHGRPLAQYKDWLQ